MPSHRSKRERTLLARLDDWQYRSGWPAGYGYDEAASLVRRIAEPGSSVAYLIDAYHGYGAGMYMDPPTGIRSLGRYEGSGPLPRVDGRPYVIADHGRVVEGDRNDTHRVAQILAERPDLEVVARFDRPRSGLGVSVLRSR